MYIYIYIILTQSSHENSISIINIGFNRPQNGPLMPLLLLPIPKSSVMLSISDHNSARILASHAFSPHFIYHHISWLAHDFFHPFFPSTIRPSQGQAAAGSELSFSHCSSALAAASGSDQAQKARCASARSRRLPRKGVLEDRVAESDGGIRKVDLFRYLGTLGILDFWLILFGKVS